MKQPKKEGINLREERVFHIRLRNTGNVYAFSTLRMSILKKIHTFKG